MKSNREKYIWIIICSMATFFTLLMNKDAMNYLLIGIMFLVPFFLIIQYPYLRKSELVIFLLFGLMIFSGLHHPNTFRWSTILYSLMYILTFIYYIRLIINVPLTINTFLKIIKFLLWAFFILMIIQQFCAIIEVPIINYRVGDNSTFKVNSLASEPSYFGKIITVLMISFISIKEVSLGHNYNLFNDIKQDRIYWIIFLYQMLLCGSSFAIVLLIIVVIRQIKVKHKTALLYITILFGVSFIIENLNFISVERVMKIGKAIVTFNEANIFESDPSGAFRIVPTILYVKQINILNADFWFGAGIDYTRTVMPDMMPGLEENSFNVGLFPSFIWDFGIIATILLIVIVFRFGITKDYPIDFLIWFIIVLDAPFNTQLFWITLILMSTNKFLKKENILVMQNQNCKGLYL